VVYSLNSVCVMLIGPIATLIKVIDTFDVVMPSSLELSSNSSAENLSY